MYFDDTVHIEKTDQCYTCEYFNKSIMCPLLEALAVGVVELTDDMEVQNCGFYKKFTRRLSLVEDADTADEPSSTDDDDQSSHKNCM